MDQVLANFWARFHEKVSETPSIGYPQATYGFFTSLDPMPEALESMAWLNERFDTWILTRPSTKNPLCYTEKRVWVENHLGMYWVDRLILCPNKGLLRGDILIDDSPWPEFQGVQLHFGSPECPDWAAVREKLGKMHKAIG